MLVFLVLLHYPMQCSADVLVPVLPAVRLCGWVFVGSDQGRPLQERGLVVSRAPRDPVHVQQAGGDYRGLRAAGPDAGPPPLRPAHESLPDDLVPAPTAGDR